MCWNDCKKVNMINCGIGACGRSTKDCTSAITDMVVDTVLAVG